MPNFMKNLILLQKIGVYRDLHSFLDLITHKLKYAVCALKDSKVIGRPHKENNRKFTNTMLYFLRADKFRFAIWLCRTKLSQETVMESSLQTNNRRVNDRDTYPRGAVRGHGPKKFLRSLHLPPIILQNFSDYYYL